MRILLIEDSLRLRSSLSSGLSYSGFSVDAVADGEQGLNFMRATSYPVVVLDLGLPGLDGMSVLKQARLNRWTSTVLVLSARDRLQDRIEALNAGADDYLVKPFAFDELVARINALARRCHQQLTPRLYVGKLEVDTAAKQALVEGVPIRLSAREYQVLELLLRRRGQMLSRSQIFELLSNADRNASDRVIEVVISNLRRKLDEAGASDIVQTRRGLGYVIE